MAEALRLHLLPDGRAEARDPKGEVVAHGHVVVDLSTDATATDKPGASLRFITTSPLAPGELADTQARPPAAAPVVPAA